MSKQKYKKAESYLTDYLTGRLYADVETRRLELKYPNRKSSKSDLREELDDPKVMTGDFNSTVENEVLKYADDGSYVFLKHYLLVIDKFWQYMSKVDKLTCDIVRLFYYDRKSWVYISQRVNLSERACRTRRTKLIKELAEWL